MKRINDLINQAPSSTMTPSRPSRTTSGGSGLPDDPGPADPRWRDTLVRSQPAVTPEQRLEELRAMLKRPPTTVPYVEDCPFGAYEPEDYRG